MKSNYLLFSVLGYITEINSSKIIKNIVIPSCKNCIYFKPSGYITDSLSTCSKFGEKNIITDEIKYDFADYCRNNEKKCGIEGKFFERDSNINLTIKNIKNIGIKIILILL
jgi:hypothetical protein